MWLTDWSTADARRLMSEEHKALGYRPPPDSLAAQAQAFAARNETLHSEDDALTVDEDILRQAAITDAERIKKEREDSKDRGLDLDFIGEGTYFSSRQKENFGSRLIYYALNSRGAQTHVGRAQGSWISPTTRLSCVGCASGGGKASCCVARSRRTDTCACRHGGRDAHRSHE